MESINDPSFIRTNRIGQGAYGIVYKAKNKESGQLGKYFQLIVIVAIKKFKESAEED